MRLSRAPFIKRFVYITNTAGPKKNPQSIRRELREEHKYLWAKWSAQRRREAGFFLKRVCLLKNERINDQMDVPKLEKRRGHLSICEAVA